MASLTDAVANQAKYAILQAPTDIDAGAASTSATLDICLKNTTTSSSVYAYVTGLDLNNNSAVFLLESDGKTLYYPSSPANDGTALSADCGILLGAPGTTTTVTIPQSAGSRIWFCVGSPLTFLLNPGPGLVEPSVTNKTDPNYELSWDFVEFTYNTAQLFANITYVDFVCLPIALSLVDTSGGTQTVEGLPADGLSTVCSELQAQSAKDGASWDQLIVPSSSSSGGSNLRVLSPTSGLAMDSSLFSGYWQPYVDLVWQTYSSSTLSVDTQVSWGTVTGSVSSNELTFGSVGGFPQPSTGDIFSCSTGAFAAYPTNTDEMGNIGARLAAAFNRSTLHSDPNQPDGEQVADYYQYDVTNHYARILHAVNLDGNGYAFPYDDVGPANVPGVAGTVSAGNPQTFTVTVGGPSSSNAVRLRDMARSGGHAAQMVGGRRMMRRGLEEYGGLVDEKNNIDLEQGYTSSDKLSREINPTQAQIQAMRPPTPQVPIQALARALGSLIPIPVRRRAAALAARVTSSPAYAYARPAVDALVRCFVALLSLSLRSLAARVLVLLGLMLGSFLLGVAGQKGFVMAPAVAQTVGGFVDVVGPGGAGVEGVGNVTVVG